MSMSIQLKSTAEIAKLREANLIVADVLDALEAACQARRDDLGAERDRRRAAQAAQGASRRSSATTATRRCCAPRSTRSSSTASRARTSSSRTATSSSHRLRRLQGRLLRRLGPDHPDRQGHARAAQALMQATRESLERAIAQCVPGNRLRRHRLGGPVARRAHGYSVVRQFVGHGIGRAMHEEPHVPNYGEAGQGAAPDRRAGARHRADGQRRGPRGRWSRTTAGRL